MKKAKQIVAIIAVALLVCLYIATFITAIFAKQHAATAFMLCLILTMVIPLMAFIAILFFGRAYGKKVIGDPEKKKAEPDDKLSSEQNVEPSEELNETQTDESVKDQKD